MKKEFKKIKFIIKQNLLRRLFEQKKLTRYYKRKAEELVLSEHKYNDELNKKQMEIRRLSIELRHLKGEI